MTNILIIFGFIALLIILFTFLYKNFLTTPSGKRTNSKQNETPEQIINRAQNLYELGQLTNAIKLLEGFIKKNPDEINVRFLLGDYLFEKKLPSKAQKQFAHILNLDQSNTIALEKISDCYAVVGKYDKANAGYLQILRNMPDNQEVRAKIANIYTKTEDYERAVTEYRTILQRNHYDTEIKENLADVYFLKTEYIKAIKEYEEIIKIDGAKLDILKKIAKANWNAGNMADAALTYKRILDVDDSINYAYKELSEVYIYMKKYEKAANVYSKMLAKNMDTSPQHHKKLADIYIMAGEFEKAIKIGRKVLAENNDFLAINETLALAYKENKNYEEAVAAYKDLIANNTFPSKTGEYKHIMSNVFCEWGNIFFKQEDYQTAMDKFVEGLQLDNGNPEVFMHLGKVNQKIKNNDAAFSHFNKAVQLSSSDPNTLLRVGQAYVEVEQITAATDLYYDAVARYPGDVAIRKALAAILIDQGFYSQAEPELKKLIEINGDKPESYYELANVYAKQNKTEEAKIYYKQALEVDPDHKESMQALSALN